MKNYPQTSTSRAKTREAYETLAATRLWTTKLNSSTGKQPEEDTFATHQRLQLLDLPLHQQVEATLGHKQRQAGARGISDSRYNFPIRQPVKGVQILHAARPSTRARMIRYETYK